MNYNLEGLIIDNKYSTHSRTDFDAGYHSFRDSNVYDSVRTTAPVIGKSYKINYLDIPARSEFANVILAKKYVT